MRLILFAPYELPFLVMVKQAGTLARTRAGGEA
jgi:hypothetical protein